MSFGEVANIFGYIPEDHNVVSFSLWGKDKKYTHGAIENAELCLVYYPDWKARFYCGADVELDVIQSLKAVGAQIYTMKDVGSWNFMFLRFWPADESNVKRFISRDCDSRISQREVDAVNAWIQEDTEISILRDHPYHRTEILGGMWGAKCGALTGLKKRIDTWSMTDQWQTDQDFLRWEVWPKVRRGELSCTIHDPFFEGRAFPSKRLGTAFVGEAFDWLGQPNKEHREQIEIYGQADA